MRGVRSGKIFSRRHQAYHGNPALRILLKQGIHFGLFSAAEFAIIPRVVAARLRMNEGDPYVFQVLTPEVVIKHLERVKGLTSEEAEAWKKPRSLKEEILFLRN